MCTIQSQDTLYLFNNNGETAFGLGFYVLTDQSEDIYEYSLSIDDERRKNFCSESAI